MVTVSCHTFQISSQYSAMARSDENSLSGQVLGVKL